MLIACLVFLLLTTNLIESKYPKQSRTYVTAIQFCESMTAEI